MEHNKYYVIVINYQWIDRIISILNDVLLFTEVWFFGIIRLEFAILSNKVIIFCLIKLLLNFIVLGVKIFKFENFLN